MRSLVSLQVCLLSKRLLTDRARKRSDILVHPHMDGQVVGFRKDFPANLSVLKFPPTCLVVDRLDSSWGGYSKFWSLKQLLLLLLLLLLCLQKTAGQTDVRLLLDDRQGRSRSR